MNAKSMSDTLFESGLFRALLVALCCQAISFFLFAPALWMPPPGRFVDQYEPLTYQPFSREMIGEAQTRHRILGPVIAKGLGLHGLPSALVPVFGGTVMLICVYLLCVSHIDPQWAFSTTLLVATTQALISSQTWLGYQDALGGAFIAGCLLSRNAWFAGLLLFLGMLAEERCAVGVPFVILWQCALHTERSRSIAVRWSLALGLAMLAWAVYFYFAIHTFVPAEVREAYDAEKVGTTWRLIFKNLNNLALGYFQSIRGGWILVGYAAYLLIRRRGWLTLSLVGSCIILGLLQAGFVADISRSASNLWPVMLLAIWEMRRSNLTDALVILRTSLFLNILSPCYQVLGNVVQYYYPLPISLLRLIYRI
ncbi:MAG: hypothetical protein U0796_03125 [Gemmatales bacterium]